MRRKKAKEYVESGIIHFHNTKHSTRKNRDKAHSLRRKALLQSYVKRLIQNTHYREVPN